MGLEALDNKIEAIRAEAAQTHQNLQLNIANINGDRTLSQEGKDAQLKSVREHVTFQLKELRAKEDKLVTDKVEELSRRLAGSVGTDPSAVIAFRDAQDRAEALEDAEKAASMMARALQTGDKSLAAALMRRALDANWTGVFQQYAAANPGSADDANDLHTLRAFQTSLGKSFERTMIYNAS